MTQQRKRRFSAKQFVEGKIRDIMARHPDTRTQAIELVIGLINFSSSLGLAACSEIRMIKEGQYDEELTFDQQVSAINRCQKELERLGE